MFNFQERFGENSNKTQQNIKNSFYAFCILLNIIILDLLNSNIYLNIFP